MAGALRWRLVVRTVLATAWAALLALCGLLAITDWTARFPGFAVGCVVAGVTLIAMAEFVFAVLVADRLFPGSSRVVSGGVQAASAATFILGAAYLAANLIGAVS